MFKLVTLRRALIATLALSSFAGAVQGQGSPSTAGNVRVVVDELAREAVVFGVDSLALARRVESLLTNAPSVLKGNEQLAVAAGVRFSRSIGGDLLAVTVRMHWKLIDDRTTPAPSKSIERTLNVPSLSSIPRVVDASIDRQVEELIRSIRTGSSSSE